MADEKKPVQDETAEKNKEAKAPVSEICGNAEEGAAALVDDDSEIRPVEGFFLTSRVRFLYRGSFPDGRTFDDCKGVPHEIVLGRRQVMKALEETLSAMEPGEERILELSPAEAYGAYDESALQRVPTYRIPNGENLPVGQMIAWKTPRSAEPVPATVVSVENQVATLDFNHPLAGKDLVYWVKLIDVVPAAGDPTA